jgi:hypothetical protein
MGCPESCSIQEAKAVAFEEDRCHLSTALQAVVIGRYKSPSNSAQPIEAIVLLYYIYGATKRNREKPDEFAALYSYRLSLSRHSFPSDFHEYVHIVKLLSEEGNPAS